MNLYREACAHLKERILPFWEGLKDGENGGFTGYVGYDLHRAPRAGRGCILNSRILYFFSQASVALKDPGLLAYADHAYRKLLEMTDARYGHQAHLQPGLCHLCAFLLQRRVREERAAGKGEGAVRPH